MFDYRKIVVRSISIVKNNKWLLIYGALVAGGFSSGSNSGRNIGDGIKRINQPNLNLEGVPKETSMVLGEFTNTLKDWVLSVSPLTWTALLTVLIIAIILGVTVSMIVGSWAKASLITGIEFALSGKDVSLKDTSPIGKTKTKKMFILEVLTAAISILISILFSVIAGAGYFLIKTGGLAAAIGIVAALAGVLVAAISFFMLTAAKVYADRYIVTSKILPIDALKKGFILAKSNFKVTAIIAAINIFLTAFAGLLATVAVLFILGVPAFIMLIPSITQQHLPSFPVWISLGLLGITFIITEIAISSMAEVFKYANWNQVFNEITGRNKK